jgi:hypothetical protein
LYKKIENSLFTFEWFLQDFKECIDAEGLMPLDTSDLHKTIGMEMRMAKAMNILNLCHGGTNSSSFVTPPENFVPNKFTFPSIDAAVRTIPTVRDRNTSINSKLSQSAVAVVAGSSSNGKDVTNGNLAMNQSYNLYNSNNADLASVDSVNSSDTFMSCQTHPFLSQGDLTVADDDDNVCSLDNLDADSLYLNTMNKNSSGTLTRGSSLYSGGVNIVDSSLSSQGQVKKSTSGDTALRNLATSPIDDSYTGSRVSLNETPVPKHRKTRFQQQQMENNNFKPKTRFDDMKGSIENLEVTVTTSSNSSKKNRRASFLPSKMITTATKQLINQHLFGIQTKGKK